MRIQGRPSPPRVAPHGLSLEPSRLRLLTAEGEALRFPTDGSTFWLGSGDGCLIRRAEAEPKHAEARWREGTLEVRGQNTLVNGMPCPDWSPLGDGGHIQLGDINQPALSLAALSDQPAQTSSQPVSITYFGDASAPNIARGVERQPFTFNKFVAQDTPVQVQGVLLQGSKIGHLAQVALPVAMGAVALGGLGACVAGLVHGVNAPLLMMGGLLMASGGMAAYSNRHDIPQHWQALREQPSLGGLPSQRVQVVVESASASNARFDETWKKSLAGWPQSRQVIYLSGHGYQDSAAGVYFHELGKSVRGAEAVMLDACNGGQIEALIYLADSAQVAVCSEHTVRGSGFPIQAMFDKQEFPKDSRAWATSLVQSGAKGRPAESLVAVDLQALKSKLIPSLDKLGRSLKSSGLNDAKQALQESERTDTSGKTTVDIGSFLARLPDSPEVIEARQALNQTVLAMTGHGTISFDTYSPAHMPAGWREFTRLLRR